jgi:hypothetical protein
MSVSPFEDEEGFEFEFGFGFGAEESEDFSLLRASRRS